MLPNIAQVIIQFLVEKVLCTIFLHNKLHEKMQTHEMITQHIYTHSPTQIQKYHLFIHITK